MPHLAGSLLVWQRFGKLDSSFVEVSSDIGRILSCSLSFFNFKGFPGIAPFTLFWGMGAGTCVPGDPASWFRNLPHIVLKNISRTVRVPE